LLENWQDCIALQLIPQLWQVALYHDAPNACTVVFAAFGQLGLERNAARAFLLTPCDDLMRKQSHFTRYLWLQIPEWVLCADVLLVVQRWFDFSQWTASLWFVA
jgi:hypothetical protein